MVLVYKQECRRKPASTPAKGGILGEIAAQQYCKRVIFIGKSPHLSMTAD